MTKSLSDYIRLECLIRKRNLANYLRTKCMLMVPDASEDVQCDVMPRHSAPVPPKLSLYSELFPVVASPLPTKQSSHTDFNMASATATDLQAPSQTTSDALNTSASTQFAPINIGTRASVLAKIQAHAVEQSLKEAHPERTYTVCPVSVLGDRDKTTPLQQLSQGENAKSLWTGELESMLEAGDLDIIVHCLKGKSFSHGF